MRRSGKPRGKLETAKKAQLDKKRGDTHKRQRNQAKWKNHFETFDEMLRKRGLRLEDIEGDGNCLFRSVSDQLFGNQNRHLDLRRVCASFMSEEKDRLQHFLDVDEDMEFDDYVQWIAKDGNWAGYFELYCLCQLLKTDFKLVLKDGSLIPIQHFHSPKCLVLAFHEDEANGIPEHYSSVRLIDDMRKTGISPYIDPKILAGIKSDPDEFEIIIPEEENDNSESKGMSKRKLKKESKKNPKKENKAKTKTPINSKKETQSEEMTELSSEEKIDQKLEEILQDLGF